MKKCGFFLLFATVLMACNDSASVSIHIDSTGKKFEDKAEKVWDTAKEGLKNLKNRVDNKLDKLDSTLEARKDSFKKKRVL